MIRRQAFLFAMIVLALVFRAEGLPWERILRVHRRQIPRRDGWAPPASCPMLPPAVPQSRISSGNVPEPLASALANAEEVLRALIQKNGGPDAAVSLGVVYDQQIIWQMHVGNQSNGQPVSASTSFRVGSLTKVVTDVALMMVRDAGGLALDDPISKCVPQLTLRDGLGRASPVSWRGLASQLSGLSGGDPCELLSSWTPVTGTCLISNEEAWQRFSATPQIIHPQYYLPHYADSAFAIVGRALESCGFGSTYESFVTNKLFAPLGMRNSFFQLTELNKWDVPAGFSGNKSLPDFVSHADMHWARPTGQLYTSLGDVAKLLSLFFLAVDDVEPAGGPAVRAQSLREMLLPAFVNADQMTAYGFPFEWFYMEGLNSARSWMVSKGGLFPGYSALLGMFPHAKLGIVALDNNQFSEVYGLVLANQILDAFAQTLAEQAPLPPNPGNLTMFAGRYVTDMVLLEMESVMTIEADEEEAVLHVFQSFLGSSTQYDLVHVAGNVFSGRTQRNQSCMFFESGMEDSLISFVYSPIASKVTTVMMPDVDPYYGWQWYRVD